MKTAILFLLITVTPNAEVHHDYFDKQGDCERAREIADFGAPLSQLCPVEGRRCEFTNQGEAAYAECIKVAK